MPTSTPSKTKFDDKQKAQTTDVDRLKEYLTHYRTELAQTIFDSRIIDKHLLNMICRQFPNLLSGSFERTIQRALNDPLLTFTFLLTQIGNNITEPSPSRPLIRFKLHTTSADKIS